MPVSKKSYHLLIPITSITIILILDTKKSGFTIVAEPNTMFTSIEKSNTIVEDIVLDVETSLSSQVYVECVKNEENEKPKRRGKVVVIF